MKKKIWIVLGIIACLLIVALCLIMNGLSEVANTSPGSVDLSVLPDGSYTGTYDFKRWTNTLTVQVKDHQITDIRVDKDVMVPPPQCAELTFSRVMQAQSTQVDAVSGATATSKAYLMAIAQALGD